MKTLTLSLIVFVIIAAFSVHSEEDRSYINARSASEKDALPFSGAVLAGDTLYLSGSIGLDEDGKIPDSAAEEARNVLNEIKSNLEAANMTMDDLVSVQIFCSDVSHYSAFNEVYKTYFTAKYPARAFIGAGTLLFNARFEVQAIAVKR
jgi:2-iminobutanoate/2-iminopropanoate deaminase